jgi:acyl carrier protein
MDINREIIEIIANYKGLSVDDVAPEKTFEELGIDSLDAIDIIYEIEEKYNLEVPQDALDLNTAQRVADIMAVIEKVRAASQGETA